MERESFEDDEVAELLNENFISIKVDREERPDLDSVYMQVCQAMNGQGGWPLNVLLTPEKKPFFAGTYFPKHSRYGVMGFYNLIKNVSSLWKHKREDLLEKSNEIVDYLQYTVDEDENIQLDKGILDKAYKAFVRDFDKTYGGFSKAPKFPTPHNLFFLFRYYKTTKDKLALDICLKTLEAMYKGGIYDHIGGGFSRYSTDKKWLAPHFEKMLYDNALLLYAYTDAYLITKDSFYKEVALSIIDYVKRDMTDQQGGFYSAEDADSEGVEGKFYVWSYDEAYKVLSEEEANIFIKYYNISKGGNFEGENIPNLIDTDIQQIENDEVLKNKIKLIKEKLFDYRKNRIHPYKDDKILTAWNGLMIAALAYAGRAFKEEEIIRMAEKAQNFIEHNLEQGDGRLFVRYRDGEAKNDGFLDDYTFIGWGLIELYLATLNPDYLRKAVETNKNMIKLFWDEKKGGFYLYGNDSEALIVRPKDIYDGAMPSGNSIAAYNILRLARITGDASIEEKFNELIKAFSDKISQAPRYYAFLMIPLLYSMTGTKDIVIVGNRETPEVVNFIKKLNDEFDSFFTLLVYNKEDALEALNHQLKDKTQLNNKVTVYVCENFTCKEPITDLDKALEEIVGNNRTETHIL